MTADQWDGVFGEPDFLGVPGLSYYPSFLDEASQQKALDLIDKVPWSDQTLRRRVQHYGYRYDYKNRSLNPSDKVDPLPPFALEIADRLFQEKMLPFMADQMIVNEYSPGQGISPHIDCVPCFNDGIATISLGWAYEMEFRQGTEKKATILEKGSALCMVGDARFKWTHSIVARLKDNGINRQRRLSLTFRKVILE